MTHLLRIFKISFIIFLICFIACGCARSNAGQEDKYFVRNVVDGDTIELANGRLVRYIGINTPETMKKHRGGNWVFDPEPYGVAAKNCNIELVFRKYVRLEFDIVKEDRYDRWLAYVYTDDGIMVNSELIRKGYTLLYTFPPNTKYMDVFLKAQEEARLNKQGLWRDLEVISPEKARNHINKFKTVRGTILNTHDAYGKIFLNFGPSRETGLSAVILSNKLPFFAKERINPAKHYKGKHVEIIGKIKYRNGLQILIDNPSQIKIID